MFHYLDGIICSCKTKIQSCCFGIVLEHFLFIRNKLIKIGHCQETFHYRLNERCNMIYSLQCLTWRIFFSQQKITKIIKKIRSTVELKEFDDMLSFCSDEQNSLVLLIFCCTRIFYFSNLLLGKKYSPGKTVKRIYHITSFV